MSCQIVLSMMSRRAALPFRDMAREEYSEISGSVNVMVLLRGAGALAAAAGDAAGLRPLFREVERETAEGVG